MVKWTEEELADYLEQPKPRKPKSVASEPKPGEYRCAVCGVAYSTSKVRVQFGKQNKQGQLIGRRFRCGCGRTHRAVDGKHWEVL